MVFVFFLVLILFWFKSLFWFSFWVKPWFLVLSMVESMFSGRPSRVKIRSLGKGLFGLLIFYDMVFGPRDCLTNTLSDLFQMFCF